MNQQLFVIILRCLFMVELIIFSIPFTLPLPRKRKFPFRVGFSCIICLLPEIFWNDAWSANVWIGVFQNVMLFTLLYLGIRLCFGCNSWMGLYCVTGAYALQRINLHLQVLMGAFKLRAADVTVFSTTLYIAVIAVLFLLAYRIFTVNIRRAGYHHIGNRANLVICLVVMISMLAFNAIDTNYRAQTPAPINTMVRLYSASCCLLTLWLQYSMFRLDKTKEENAVILQLWEREKKHLALSRETVDMINIKCHDMKHLIALLKTREGHHAQEELNRIEELVSIYDFSVDTQNDTLNLVLAEKGLLCQSYGIQLNCIANGQTLRFMEETDIYFLFCNALDNAIRAVQAIGEKEKRIIKLTVLESMGMISIGTENFYTGQLSFEGGLPVTSQLEDAVHGYGTRSMRYVAEKYGGEMSIGAKDGIFSLNILIPAMQ